MSLLRHGFRWLPGPTRSMAANYMQLRDLRRAVALRQGTIDALEQVDAASPSPDMVVRNHYRFLADVAWLQNAPMNVLTQIDVQLIGAEVVRSERAAGRGLLIACNSAGCFYMSFLAASQLVDDLLIITPHKPTSGEEPLLERLQMISGISLRLVQAGPQAAILIARQWKRGGAVATMLDSHLSGTPFIVAPFFGRPAACPRGIYDLVTRLQPTVVHAHLQRNGLAVEVTLDQPIDPAGCSSEQVAARVNAQIEERILADPDKWPLWATLPARWMLAQHSGNG